MKTSNSKRGIVGMLTMPISVIVVLTASWSADHLVAL